jgi:hypothetical protein
MKQSAPARKRLTHPNDSPAVSETMRDQCQEREGASPSIRQSIANTMAEGLGSTITGSAESESIEAISSK